MDTTEVSTVSVLAVFGHLHLAIVLKTSSDTVANLSSSLLPLKD